MGVGISGLASNLDTDTIVKAMVSTYTSRKETYEKEQTKLQWTQDSWKAMNTKIYNLYSKTLSDLRFTNAYSKKRTTVSDSTVATISSNNSSVNGTQSLAVRQLAKSGYLTGAKIATTSSGNVSNDTTLADLGISDTSIDVTVGASTKSITLKSDMKVSSVVSELQKAGLNASFDATNQRFFVSAQDSGASKDFSLSAGGSNGLTALRSLGLYTGTTSADLSNYSKWAAYSQEKLNALITSTAEAKYTSADAQKTLLTSTNKTLASANTKLTTTNETLTKTNKLNQYAYDYADSYLGSDWASEEKVAKRATERKTVQDQIDAYNTRSKNGETLSDEEKVDLAELKMQISAMDQVDKALGADTLTTEDREDYHNKLSEGITSNLDIIAANEATIATNVATITENEAIIAGTSVNTTLQQMADEKNATTLANVTEELTNRWETSQAYMVQYNYLNDSGSGITEAEYNSAVAAIGDIKATTASDGSGATRIEGQDAMLELNGALFQSGSNTLTINGLTITATNTTGKNEDGTYKTVSLTTATDIDGIYDIIKNFFKEYNTLINEMDKMYNASSSKGYNILSSDQKAEMTEDEIDDWETKIKDSLLRKDSTLDSVSYSMRNAISKGVEVDGKTFYLSSFGIGTLGYFLSGENEKNAYHIDGDSDDSSSSGKTDKLKTAIASDPDTVMKFFSGMTTNLYNSLYKQMQSTTLSSAYTVYNDKQMATDYTDYTKKIASVEEEIAHWENFYYSKFTAMETALSKLNSQTSQLSALLGS